MPAVEFHTTPYRHYLVDGVELPSATTIINETLHKEALAWWGQAAGIRGICELLAVEQTRVPALSALFGGDHEMLVELLVQEKLSCNHIRDAAGQRGTNIHEAMRRHLVDGVAIVDEDFSAEEVGYARSLRAWIEDHRPEPIVVEAPIASTEHGYAGTPDLLCELDAHRAPLLVDFKTSKRIFPLSHFPQLAAYEQALVECGHPRPGTSIVVRLGQRKLKTGKPYENRVSDATLDDFLAIKGAWHVTRKWAK